jgi:MoxR-like ATPase
MMASKQNPKTRLRYHRRLPQMTNDPPAETAALDAPDRRDGRVYLMSGELQLAVEVALTTGRPLLLRGAPGSGKSSLAAFIARNLGYRYYEHTVTAATRAQDLLWRFDTVRRLSDAQVRKAGDPPLRDADYVEPGVLWWAFDRDSASRRGTAKQDTRPGTAGKDTRWVKPAIEPNAELNEERRLDRAVVLIDEIDKADPDVPNGLLEPLSLARFVVTETRAEIERPIRTAEQAAADPIGQIFIVITTNEERDLPPAFIRRCVVFKLDQPNEDRLLDIARLHMRGSSPALNVNLGRSLAKRTSMLQEQAEKEGLRPPGVAEYLDAVRACTALEITPGDSLAWRVLAHTTLAKWQSHDEDEQVK